MLFCKKITEVVAIKSKPKIFLAQQIFIVKNEKHLKALNFQESKTVLQLSRLPGFIFNW